MASIYCGKHFHRIYGLNVASKKLLEELKAEIAAYRETGTERASEKEWGELEVQGADSMCASVSVRKWVCAVWI